MTCGSNLEEAASVFRLNEFFLFEMRQSVRDGVASGRLQAENIRNGIALAANLAFHKVAHCLSNAKLRLAREALV